MIGEDRTENVSWGGDISVYPLSLPVILIRDLLSLSGSTVSWNLGNGRDEAR